MLLSQLSDESKKLFLNLEMILANVDGEFSESEKKAIANHCAEMKIEPIAYDETVQLENVISAINNTMTKKEKKIVFIELVSIALVDGEYHESEKKFIESLREFLQIPEEVSEQAVGLMQKLLDISKEIDNFVEW